MSYRSTRKNYHRVVSRAVRQRVATPSLPPGDNTPDPFTITYTPGLYYEGTSPYSNTMRITGVDTSIDIRLVLTSGVAATVYYKISSGRLNPGDYGVNPGSWTVLNFTLNTSASITVPNNYNFGFAVDLSVPGSNTYQIQNVSDANVVLNTFTMEKLAVINYNYGTFLAPTGTDRDHGTFAVPAAFNEDFNIII
jgi:hypothetical protein